MEREGKEGLDDAWQGTEELTVRLVYSCVHSVRFAIIRDIAYAKAVPVT